MLVGAASAAFSGSSSDVTLSSVSASAPLVFSDSDGVLDSDVGDSDALSDGAATVFEASRTAVRFPFWRASFFSLSFSSFSAFCSSVHTCQ